MTSRGRAWTGEHWPPVSAVVPTHERPAAVRAAVRSVLGQDYPGTIECIVVFDQTEPHPIEPGVLRDGRRLRVLRNERTPGLAGARNTGVLAAEGEVIAHCDDDDEWLPEKLLRQLTVWRANPDAPVVASGLRMLRGGTGRDRRAPPRTRFADFLSSRVMEIHSSSLLVRTADMREVIGLVDEDLPHSFGEDYEWLLRATKQGDVVAVPEPLVRIGFDGGSHYLSKWRPMIEGLRYILDKVPEFASDPAGLARIQSQIAFAYSATGARGPAFDWARRALRNDPGQPKAWAALAVASRLVRSQWLVRVAHATGQGI